MVSTTPVTIEQAAALMGVSATTIRRRIKAGDLRVTETRRPQGIVWLVHLPPGIHPPAEVDTTDTASVATAPSTEPAITAQAEALTGLVQATVATVLGPLVAELAAGRQTVERQAERLEAQAEQLGQLRERLATLTPSHTPGASILEPPAPGAPLQASPPWWRSSWLLVVLLLAGWLVSVLLWPR